MKTDNIDTFKELTNFIYDLNDSRIYDLPSDKENKERVTQLINKIGKNNIYNYLKENMSSSFFEDKDNMKNFMEYIYNFIISKKLKINENNLSEINNLLDLALLEFRKCYDYKLIKNNDKNKRFFLPNDAPEELKKKFYSKTMTYTDLLNNIEYFNDTNMSLGLWWHNYAKGVFDNDFLLQLLKSTNGNLDAVYIKHLKNIGFEKINYEKYVELLEKYFEEHRFTYEVLQQLKQLNIKLSNIDEIENNIKNSGMMIESLYATDIRLFSNNIVNNFGYDVIRTIAEFHRTNAMDLFIKYTQNSNELERIRNWFIYLSENDILNKKTIIKSILSYENCIDLIDNLLNNNIKLTDSQRSNLSSILDIENRYNVKNTEELSNYQKHKEDILKDKFNSDNIGYVKGAIYEILFNDFLVTNIFLDYKISYIEYFKYNFVDTKLIEPNLLAAITIIDNIKKFNGSPDELRDKYQQIIKVGTLYNAQELRAELDKLYTKLWNNSMFNHKENSYSKKFDVKGIDGDVCRYDAFGNLISSNDNIDVYELDGEPFKLIVHSFKPGKTPDESFRSIGEKLYENPSAWNMVDGSTTLSTSLISDKHIATFQPYDDENAVFYGFNNVPSDVIKACKNGDGGTGHGGGYFTFNSELVTPDNLIKNSTMHNYNEVVLFRKSILENNSFDGKVQPTCIVCFDGKINEASKLAAQYFRVPIYMINVKKYRSDYMNNFTKYCEGNIDKFDNQDINYLLSLPNSYDVDTCDLCLSLCDKAFNEGIINCNEYYDRLCYMYYVIAKTCLYRKKVKIILKNKIEEARQIMEESKNDGIRRQ